MKKHIAIIGLVFCLGIANAQAAEVMDIVKKTVHASYYAGKDGRATVQMQIIDRQGRERIRQLILLRKNMDEQDGPQKYYAYFKKPADVKKMVFMAWKNIDRDDDRWLYLPALDLVKRIAASDERTSFVGSHFFYEDVSGRGITEDNHELIEETEQYYLIKSTPKNPEAVEFAYYKNRVDKSTFLPMKAEYFKNNDTVYRSYTALKVEVIDGYATVVQSQMEDHIGGGKTILNYSGVKYDIGMPDNIFSERYLRRAPRKYLR